MFYKITKLCWSQGFAKCICSKHACMDGTHSIVGSPGLHTMEWHIVDPFHSNFIVQDNIFDFPQIYNLEKEKSPYKLHAFTTLRPIIFPKVHSNFLSEAHWDLASCGFWFPCRAQECEVSEPVTVGQYSPTCRLAWVDKQWLTGPVPPRWVQSELAAGTDQHGPSSTRQQLILRPGLT